MLHNAVCYSCGVLIVCDFYWLYEGSPGSDNDNLKSVVIGLSPMGSHGDMETVFCLPPIPQENVLQFAIVPSYLKSEAEGALLLSQADEEDDEDTDNNGTDPKEAALRRTITPAVMLLTQWHATEDDDDPDQTVRNLKVVRCPAVDMACWALEVGQLQDPRLAVEVLPGRSNVTVSVSLLLKTHIRPPFYLLLFLSLLLFLVYTVYCWFGAREQCVVTVACADAPVRGQRLQGVDQAPCDRGGVGDGAG